MSPDQEYRLAKIFSALRNLQPLAHAVFLERVCGGQWRAGTTRPASADAEEARGESPSDGAGINERSCHEHQSSQMQLQPL
jgi:hypothetical protein